MLRELDLHCVWMLARIVCFYDVPGSLGFANISGFRVLWGWIVFGALC